MPVAMAVFGRVVTKPEDFTKAVSKLKGHAKTLNSYLEGKQFLAGEKLSVADVVCSCALIMSFQTVFDAGFRKGMPHLTAWFQRCISHPSFIRQLGHIKMTEKAFKAWDPATPAVVVEKAPAKKEEDLDDLFGDDDNDAEAAKEAAAKVKAAAAAKPKKVVIAMSIVMLEVKPLDDTTDLGVLAQKIFSEIT